MADAVATIDGLDYFKLPDWNRRKETVDAGEANIFNGALVERDLTTGLIKHADPATVNPVAGVSMFNNDVLGVAAGASIEIHRGIAIGGLSIPVGTPGIADQGRPMYLKAFDNEIADWSNAAAIKKFVGWLESSFAAEEDYEWLRIPGFIPDALDYGVTQRLIAASVTDTSAGVVTGLGEVVQIVSANIVHGESGPNGGSARAQVAAGAGQIDIEVFTAAGGAPGVEIDVEIVVRGFLRAILA